MRIRDTELEIPILGVHGTLYLQAEVSVYRRTTLTHCLLSSIHNMRRLGELISAYITEIEVKLHGDYRQYSPHIMRI